MNWSEYFLDMSAFVATKSKDESTKCGAVIAKNCPDYSVLSTGYNSFPRGVVDDKPERQERPLKYSWIEHAERNAIYNAARTGVSLIGSSIYQDWLPCVDCARAIIQAGITHIYIDGSSPKNNDKKVAWESRWGESMDIACDMLMEANVGILIYDRKREWADNYVRAAL